MLGTRARHMCYLIAYYSVPYNKVLVPPKLGHLLYAVPSLTFFTPAQWFVQWGRETFPTALRVISPGEMTHVGERAQKYHLAFLPRTVWEVCATSHSCKG